MSTIERPPHPLFAGLWLAWFAAVLVALTQPARPLVGLVVLLVFLAIEIPAAILTMPGNARDTLSEVTTWAVRHTARRRDFARGWNALLLIVILSIAWLLMRTVSHYADSDVLGVLFGGLTVVWLWDHFQSPDVWG
jgi:hypothetical protein